MAFATETLWRFVDYELAAIHRTLGVGLCGVKLACEHDGFNRDVDVPENRTNELMQNLRAQGALPVRITVSYCCYDDALNNAFMRLCALNHMTSTCVTVFPPHSPGRGVLYKGQSKVAVAVAVPPSSRVTGHAVYSVERACRRAHSAVAVITMRALPFLYRPGGDAFAKAAARWADSC